MKNILIVVVILFISGCGVYFDNIKINAEEQDSGYYTKSFSVVFKGK